MRVGYPCINHSLGSKAYRTFRLASYSDHRFRETVASNLAYVRQLLVYNAVHNLKFLRIGSGVIPFASHPVLRVSWQEEFASTLQELGTFIKKNGIRISMHPDQFVLINSTRKDVVEAAIRDLVWHAEILDLMGLAADAKIQIHVGGVYGDRGQAIRRFIANYVALPGMVKRRLVIENDDRCFSLNDCMRIYDAVGVPVLFDNFHHECLNHGETLFEAIMLAHTTWQTHDGPAMVDYSSQQSGAVRGKHAQTLDVVHFRQFIHSTGRLNFDLMLEIKDKEVSALHALREIDLIKKQKQEVVL